MSESDLESLPPELARLLTAEKTRPDPPAEMQARVLARFGGELLGASLSADPGASAAAPAGAKLPLLRKLPLAATMLAIGGLGGAALHAYLGKPVQTTIYIPVPAPPRQPVPEPTPPPVTREPEPATPTKTERHRDPGSRRPPPASVPVAPPNSPPAPAAKEGERRLARDRELAAERALIEQARTALARGKAADALVLLGRHQRVFAGGQLVEEGEALEIMAIAATGQTAAARARAAKFREAYPKSMLLRSIDAALAGGR